MEKLPGYFTITAPGVRTTQEFNEIEDLAESKIDVAKELTPDDSSTVYSLTRPVPYSIAAKICDRLGVSIDACRWGDTRINWSFLLDMPLEPNGRSLLQSIRAEYGSGQSLGIRPVGIGKQTKLQGDTTPDQHGLDTILYGLEANGHQVEKFDFRELPIRH